MNRLISLFILPLLLLFSQSSQAQIINVMPDEAVMGINCGFHICLDKLSIKKTIYQSYYYECSTYDNKGNCTAGKSPVKFIYGHNAMNVLMYSMNSAIARSSSSTERKNVSWKNCYDTGYYGNIMCYFVDNVWTHLGDNNWGWQEVDGGNISTSHLAPRDCPSGTYIPGAGCAVTQYTDSNGVTYKTERKSLDISPTCNLCDSSPGGQINGVIDDITGISKAKNASNPKIGNPVNLNNGGKIELKKDLNYPIALTRSYFSQRSGNTSLGFKWRHNYDKSLGMTSYTQNGVENVYALSFNQENDDSVMFSRTDANAPFVPLFADQKGYSVIVSGTNYVLTYPDKHFETYDNEGRFLQYSKPNGAYYQLAYSNNKLTTITDNYGNWLQFIYSDYADVIVQVNSSSGDYIQYQYLNGYIIEAKFNNSETVGYTYSNGNLISKIDENGIENAFFTYDNEHRVIENKHMYAAVLYNSRYLYSYSNGSIMVTLPDNTISNYSTANQLFKNKVTNSNLAGNKNSNSVSYDYSGNISNYSYGSTYNSYSYDTNNKLISSNYKGVTRNFTWSGNYLSSYTESSANGNRNYTFNYDSIGNLIQKQITGSGKTLSWSYTYTTFGRVATMTEPNGAVTVYGYYPDNHVYKGLLNSITNSLGQTIVFNSYNKSNPTNITLPNGLIKNLTYDLRGRVLSESISNTSGQNIYTYNAAGDLLQASLATGYILNMNYDLDHRMTGISDNRGNSIVYTLDTNGNPANERQYTAGTLVSAKNRIFDSLSRITQISTPGGFSYSYTYDEYNRVTGKTNPDSVSETYNYDTRDYLTGTNGSGRNHYIARDIDGNIISLSQQGNTTDFTFNDMGEILTMSSPDTGNHTYSVNIAAKTRSHTDAANVTETTSLDSLDRPISVVRGNMTEAYTWDTNSVGKLSSISDASGTTSYNYSNSRLSSKTHHNGKTVSYGYNNVGQLNTLTYPSGLSVSYTYTNGALSGISVGGTTVLNQIVYRGFNSTPVGWTWGSGNNRSKGFNTDERLTGLSDSNIINQAISQDNIGNVTASNDTANSLNSFGASYNTANQITGFNHNSGNKAYSPDSKFNLVGITPFDTTGNMYAYLNSNKLSAVNIGSTSRYPSYDVKGNMLTDGKGGTYTYDLANNMVSASNGKNSTYYYNALHQRVAKTVVDNGVTTTTYFAYNESGQLLGEYDSNGNAIAEHIYLKDIPVAVVKNGNIYYVHTDYLNTPRAITNSSGSVVWKWNNTNAYGNNPATEVIPGFEYNLRFTGQYFDKETSLHYNYHRMYNPELGRYMQPDPIGVNGGMNIYSYVENNPLNAVDPLGLDIWKEQRSGNEPPFHQGISIGNPLGTYITFSFGISPSVCVSGCVYEENELGGKITNFIKSSDAQDKMAIQYIESMINYDNTKFYAIELTCISYTDNKFKEIKKLLNLEESVAPNRFPKKINENNKPVVSLGLTGLVTTISTTILK